MNLPLLSLGQYVNDTVQKNGIRGVVHEIYEPSQVKNSISKRTAEFHMKVNWIQRICQYAPN